MSDVAHGPKSLADRRYLHFVLLRGGDSLTASAYWRLVGDTLATDRSFAPSAGGTSIQHRKYRSESAFARGEVAALLSERGAGRPPYFYDLFVAKMQIGSDSVLLLGFPFASLAREITQRVLSRQALSKGPSFLGVDVPKLIRVMERGIKVRYEAVRTSVVGVQIVVTDDRSLTAVRLGGDDPLSADIYREFLQERVRAGALVPEQCVLSVDRDADARAGGGSAGARHLRSRLHVDIHGNFKFYAHVDCSNISLLPSALGQLAAVNCLKTTSQNPTLRGVRDDDE